MTVRRSLFPEVFTDRGETTRIKGAPVDTNWVGENFTILRTLAPSLSLNRSRDLVAALFLAKKALEREDACLFARGYFGADIEFAPSPTADCLKR